MNQTRVHIIGLMSLMFSLVLSVLGCSDSIPAKTNQKLMPLTLQQRANVFLTRPIPKGMAYVPDSMSERFIVTFAEKGEVDLDPELTELLEICAVEGERAAAEKSGEEQEFFRESAAILRGILTESKVRR